MHPAQLIARMFMEINKIKFKAKCIWNGKWVEGYFYKECENTYIIENKQSESLINRNRPYLVEPNTICQFTGLKDQNGKEVWEHDIIECRYFKGEILFFNGCFRVQIYNGACFPFTTLFTSDGKIDNCEVIGNKFDKKYE